MYILGIESSCDDTSAAVVKDGIELLSNIKVSQIDIHRAYGGVVPEIAARSHIEAIQPVISRALSAAFMDQELDMLTSYQLASCMKNIDAVAVTYGAGLSGSLLVGVNAARILAREFEKPLHPMNHVEGHVYANFINPSLGNYPEFAGAGIWMEPQFPVLALIVSGGHTQLVLFQDHGKYKLLGQKIDDAAGEAFDKFARVIGLPYPGGVSIERATEEPGADENKYDFPKARTPNKYDFSFSGVKTAGLRKVQQLCGVDHTFPSFDLPEKIPPGEVKHLAASFNRVICETLADKTIEAFREFAPKSVVIAGGVAASKRLRQELSARLPIDVSYADFRLCTDNAAMIASLAYFRSKIDQPAGPDFAQVNPRLKM